MLRLKCTKIDFGCCSVPDPAGGAYSTPPDPLAGFKGGPLRRREGGGAKGRAGRERGGWEGRDGRIGVGRGGKGRGGEGWMGEDGGAGRGGGREGRVGGAEGEWVTRLTNGQCWHVSVAGVFTSVKCFSASSRCSGCRVALSTSASLSMLIGLSISLSSVHAF